MPAGGTHQPGAVAEHVDAGVHVAGSTFGHVETAGVGQPLVGDAEKRAHEQGAGGIDVELGRQVVVALADGEGREQLLVPQGLVVAQDAGDGRVVRGFLALQVQHGVEAAGIRILHQTQLEVDAQLEEFRPGLRVAVVHGAAHVFLHHGKVPLAERLEEVFLVAEVPVDGASAQSGRAGDFFERGPGHPALMEHHCGSVEQGMAGLEGFFSGAFHGMGSEGKKGEREDERCEGGDRSMGGGGARQLRQRADEHNTLAVHKGDAFYTYNHECI